MKSIKTDMNDDIATVELCCCRDYNKGTGATATNIAAVTTNREIRR